MKKIYLIILFSITVYITQAQIINIPDINLKNRLVNTNCVDSDLNGTYDSDADTNNDGEISISEAEAISILSVSGNPNLPQTYISSLEGIQYFTNLTKFWCYYNDISELDITPFVNLEELNCRFNEITSLDVSQNLSLINLQCAQNPLGELDLSQNSNLQILECSENSLTSLDLTQNANLIELYCFWNDLTTLDFSNNINLSVLYCKRNFITDLDLTQNLNLTSLVCSENQIPSLDLSSNSNLIYIECAQNLLSDLNLKNGNNSVLTSAYLAENPLLTCIGVDNEVDANLGIGWYLNWTKDSEAIYSEDCSSLNIVEEKIVQSIFIYPNPVKDIIRINSEKQISKVEIYSISGKKIKEMTGYFLNSISTESLQNGVYIFKFSLDNGRVFKKIVKN